MVFEIKNKSHVKGNNDTWEIQLDIIGEEQNKKAIQQIAEIKKYMIGASEFDVLEKLIDLNADKYVIDYQMEKVEKEGQDSVCDTSRKIMFSQTEKRNDEEMIELSEPLTHDITPKRNVPLTRRDKQEDTSRRPMTKSARRNLFGRHSAAEKMRVTTPVRSPVEQKIEEPQFLCSDNGKNTENKLIQNLEELLDAEYVDAKAVSSYIPKGIGPEKKCEGLNIPENLSFKESVERSLSAAIEKLSEKDDHVQPEVAAAMLHSEEKGVSLSKAPREIYDSLFPGAGKHVIEITSASSAKPRDVLPVPASQIKSKHKPPKEDAELLDYMRLADDKRFSLPEANIQDEGGENEDDVLGLVDSQILNEEAATFKVMLAQDASATTSQVQMRGSQPPSWFPGYFVALPNHDEIISLEKPWTVLEKAWQTFRPTNIKPKKGAVVLGN